MHTHIHISTTVSFSQQQFLALYTLRERAFRGRHTYMSELILPSTNSEGRNLRSHIFTTNRSFGTSGTVFFSAETGRRGCHILRIFVPPKTKNAFSGSSSPPPPPHPAPNFRRQPLCGELRGHSCRFDGRGNNVFAAEVKKVRGKTDVGKTADNLALLQRALEALRRGLHCAFHNSQPSQAILPKQRRSFAATPCSAVDTLEKRFVFLRNIPFF